MLFASMFMLLFASMFFIGLFFVIVNIIMIIVWKVRKRRNKNPRKWWFITSTIGLIISILITLFLIGYIGSSMNKFKTKEKENYRFEKVIEALEDKDKDALKAVFSTQALSDADDFDEHMDCLFDFFEGTVESWERLPGGGESESGSAGRREMVDLFYNVNTKENSYSFYMLNYPVDEQNPDNVGLYTLRIVKEENRREQLFAKDMDMAGIYVPTIDGLQEDEN